MYLQKNDDVFQVISFYVDDLFIIGSCTKEIGSIKAYLHSELGLLKQFLGLEIEQYKRGIMIRQQKYA